MNKVLDLSASTDILELQRILINLLEYFTIPKSIDPITAYELPGSLYCPQK
jgi:hypothetical protein